MAALVGQSTASYLFRSACRAGINLFAEGGRAGEN